MWNSKRKFPTRSESLLTQQTMAGTWLQMRSKALAYGPCRCPASREMRWSSMPCSKVSALNTAAAGLPSHVKAVHNAAAGRRDTA